MMEKIAKAMGKSNPAVAEGALSTMLAIMLADFGDGDTLETFSAFVDEQLADIRTMAIGNWEIKHGLRERRAVTNPDKKLMDS